MMLGIKRNEYRLDGKQAFREDIDFEVKHEYQFKNFQ